MAIDAYEFLKGSHPRLVAKVLDKNEDYSRFLHGVLSHLVDLLVQRRRDPRELRYRLSIEDGNILKVLLHFESISGSMPPDKHILWRKNPDIATLMQVNHYVETLPLEITQYLENWIVRHYPDCPEAAISDFRIEDAKAMAPDFMVLRAEIVTSKEFNERTKERLNIHDPEWVN